DLQYVIGKGRIKVLQVTPGPEVRTIATTGGGFGSVPTTPLSRVDAGSPERLARAAARELRQKTARVDYVTF
ncbi:hypothetical protein, partial [Klebsiella pneumoniae]|uniref:hypothetical protein n=1 Tax=Klebsiella pneumoniae TaxID=573 RepID=UPI0013D22D24